jgi:hypothetical protein
VSPSLSRLTGADDDDDGGERIEAPGLHEACVELAHVVLAASQPNVSRDILETLADRFEREALDFALLVTNAGRDPALLGRAVHYLTDAHALPLMGTDMEWFRQALACLVELAVPGIALSSQGGAFLRDVQVGIEQSLQDLDD